MHGRQKGMSTTFTRNTNDFVNTYRGCRLLIPTLEASAPVMNGKTADPACPKPAIQPIDPVRSQGGSTRPAWFITMG